MDIQRPLYWHQGLFLQPHHFQLLDLSFRSLLTPYHDSLGPHYWGIGETEIQKASLGNGSFNPLKGNFLFPDGTHVVLSENALIEARSFDEAWVEGGKPLSVYIGLKKWNNAGENVTVLEKLESFSDVNTRYVTVADPEEVMDLHSGGPQGKVKRLYFVLKVFWETERNKLGDYILVPIAQLERVGEEIVLSQRFIPPCLTISSSEPLLKIIKEIRDQVTARSHHLEEYKRHKGVQTAEFGSRDMAFLLALRSLNRYVPMLHHFTESQHVQPWIVYGTLRQLIGELSSFSEKINVIGEVLGGDSNLPGYDHRNLWNCFSSAQDLIIKLLDEITAGPDYVIPMVYDGTYFALDLKPAVFEGRNRFYLVFKTEEDPETVIQSMATIAKLSTREHLPILIARALPGIEMQHLPVPPQELPKRANSIYFAINIHNDQWSMVTKDNNLALYWDHTPEDIEAEMMIVGS
ncbi:MAG: type VI secretion system baseplate subunit TssK [Planctomycetota bacterium]|jgi:type VI secretion system protein ImpJ